MAASARAKRPTPIRLSPSSPRSSNSLKTPSSASALRDPLDSQRVDKWLWHARVVRTRSAATALAAAGYVRVNGTRVAAGQAVRRGDVVTVALDRSVRVMAVQDFSERRGDSTRARGLYRAVRA
ncbi:MAG: RNA-binding S4 domain-containing protein [Pseudolabrys sp.]|nr:RNA-binding S4 domain-containing protein [Pseudolabrys sp.]MBV9954967.1 RNA-binding S4 domain-containing protein [Pseudolabrys sp.]